MYYDGQQRLSDPIGDDVSLYVSALFLVDRFYAKQIADFEEGDSIFWLEHQDQIKIVEMMSLPGVLDLVIVM